jgi:hypothetical protein
MFTGLGIVLALYALRAVLYRYMEHGRRIALVLGVAFALAVPTLWIFLPRSAEHPQPPFGNWVFPPTAWLAVPLISSAVDLTRGRHDLRRCYLRFPLEVFVGIPLWIFI